MYTYNRYTSSQESIVFVSITVPTCQGMGVHLSRLRYLQIGSCSSHILSLLIWQYTYLSSAYTCIFIPSNINVHVLLKCRGTCATSASLLPRTQPNAGPLTFIGHGAAQLPLCFFPCAHNNTLVIVCRRLTRLIAIIFPLSFTSPDSRTRHCLQSLSFRPRARPSRDAVPSRPRDRRVAAADTSSPWRCRPHMPRCASTSRLSHVHPSSVAISPAVGLPTWLFKRGETRHPPEGEGQRQRATDQC